MTSVTGNPLRAYAIAGASSSFIGSLPNFACSSNQPSTAPGTDTGSGPVRRNGRRIQLLEFRAQLLERERLRGTAAAIEAVELLRLRVPDDGEQVAAHAVADGLHEPERRVGGDRRVHRRAAALQDIERHLAHERMAGRRHAVRGDDFGARGHQRTAGARARRTRPSMVTRRMAAIASARARRRSGRLLGARDARLENLSDFAIE